MPLFQESIVKKHLSKIDASVIESAYLEYKRVYSPEKIKNIKVAKEEQYQEGFIKDVFGSVLGYSVYPEHPYNIETEKKNETNSKKADGAILKDEKVVGVIELKDNKTKNLEAVKDQAFGYKHNHKECSYVISSNFHKLRFYIDDATDYEEFDLYNLDKETFKRFYLYLRKEGLLDKNLPKLLREETKFHEEEISKKLYKDYSNFKRSFYENAVKNNPGHDKLLLFKKSQKFLDRILFLLFAEDKGLVGTNSIVNIVEKWSGADDDYYRPLYEMVNTYFGHLYRGYTYQKTGEVIPQFGGELFAPDEVLEVLKIDDDILKNDLLILSKYDFNTDVDVNILGHIFEHSLNEVDDVEAELRGEQLDKTKSKRKKDGVFYTPKYITKYIIDNTLGKLCDEKKAELKLDQDIAIFDYQKADGKLNEKGKELYERLNSYKSWLLTLKVCDPACGSGAFLNQALSFFIEEHKFVDDIIAELTNTPLRLFDTDLQILENNIFGVDINEESIEIAKLSLWLRTAQQGRKLSDLSNNIKCGNSLIDDPTVAVDKAFNWREQFPEIFVKGGFDVIIGNPPYVFGGNEGVTNNEKNYFKAHYETGSGKINLFTLFIELSHRILKQNGEFSFIIPNTFLRVTSYDTSRKFFIKNFKFRKLFDAGNDVFEGATTTAIILIATKAPSNSKDNVQIIKSTAGDFNELKISDIVDSRYVINSNLSSHKLELMKKLRKNRIQLGQICKEMIFGVVITKNKDELVSKEQLPGYKPFLEGKDISSYLIKPIHSYLKYDKSKLHRARAPEIFEVDEKLLVQRITGGATPLKVAYDNKQSYNKESINNIIVNDDSGFQTRTILCLLNSKLINWFYNNAFTNESTLTVNVSKEYLSQIPIVKPSNQEEFVSKADAVLNFYQELNNKEIQFIKYLTSQYPSIEESRSIQNWTDLTFSEFILELKKFTEKTTNNILSKSEEMEWMELFETKLKETIKLKSMIKNYRQDIDRMVYELYGLTEEEIQIVENS